MITPSKKKMMMTATLNDHDVISPPSPSQSRGSETRRPYHNSLNVVSDSDDGSAEENDEDGEYHENSDEDCSSSKMQGYYDVVTPTKEEVDGIIMKHDEKKCNSSSPAIIAIGKSPTTAVSTAVAPIVTPTATTAATAAKTVGSSPATTSAAMVNATERQTQQKQKQIKQVYHPPGHIYALRKLIVVDMGEDASSAASQSTVDASSTIVDNAMNEDMNETMNAAMNKATEDAKGCSSSEKEDLQENNFNNNGSQESLPSKYSASATATTATTAATSTATAARPRIVTANAVRITEEVYQSMDSVPKNTASSGGIQTRQGKSVLMCPSSFWNKAANCDDGDSNGKDKDKSNPSLLSNCQYFQGVAVCPKINANGSTNNNTGNDGVSLSLPSQATSAVALASKKSAAAITSTPAAPATAVPVANSEAYIAAIQTSAVRKRIVQAYPSPDGDYGINGNGRKRMSNCPLALLGCSEYDSDDEYDDSDYSNNGSFGGSVNGNLSNVDKRKARQASSKHIELQEQDNGNDQHRKRNRWRKIRFLPSSSSVGSLFGVVRDCLGRRADRRHGTRKGDGDQANGEVNGATTDEAVNGAKKDKVVVAMPSQQCREGQERLAVTRGGGDTSIHKENFTNPSSTISTLEPELQSQSLGASPKRASKASSKSTTSNKRKKKHHGKLYSKQKNQQNSTVATNNTHRNNNKHSKPKHKRKQSKKHKQGNNNNKHINNHNKQYPPPKMVIKNGRIDWENSQLENVSSLCSGGRPSFVAYSISPVFAAAGGGAGGAGGGAGGGGGSNSDGNGGATGTSSTTQASTTTTTTSSSRRLLLSKNNSNANPKKKASSSKHRNNTTTNSKASGNSSGNTTMMSGSSNNIPIVPSTSLGATIFGDESVIHNSIRPINEIVCIDPALGIYVSESGLSFSDCQNIINVAEYCAASRGGWSSYTYAKQTLGCRENDQLAFVSARPVMTACATIRKHLMDVVAQDETKDDGKKICGRCVGELCSSANTKCKCNNESQKNGCSSDNNNNNLPNNDNSTMPESRNSSSTRPSAKKKELVLDVREPHVVKYDTSRTERQKLDMHTDKSEWTFLIALSEGRGGDYTGGGTYFQALNCTVHLQRSQMLIFRGKLRHCGVAISSGCRYLLVGFLVPQVRTANS